MPNVLHYGLLYEIKEAGYRFDKHWYANFDALQCPPWEIVAAGTLPKKGLFPFPPHPSTLTSQVTPKFAARSCKKSLKALDICSLSSAGHHGECVLQGEALLRDLLSVQVAATLNEALCANYRRQCPPSTELETSCAKVSVCRLLVMLCFHALAADLESANLGLLLQATKLFKAVLEARQKLKDSATEADCQDSEVLICSVALPDSAMQSEHLHFCQSNLRDAFLHDYRLDAQSGPAKANAASTPISCCVHARQRAAYAPLVPQRWGIGQ